MFLGNLIKRTSYEIEAYKEANITFGYAEMVTSGNLIYLHIAGINIENPKLGEMKLISLPVRVLGIQQFVLHNDQGKIIEKNCLLKLRNNTVSLLINDLSTVVNQRLSFGGCISITILLN